MLRKPPREKGGFFFGKGEKDLLNSNIFTMFYNLIYYILDRKMNLTHIEHIGIAVENMEAAIAYYENILGLKCYKIEEVADQKVKTAFFQIGQTKIELLESTAPDGPVAKFIEKKGPGIHHIAFAAKGLQESLDDAAAKGVSLIDKQPRKGAEGLNIAFLHPKSTLGVLTELCEHPEN